MTTTAPAYRRLFGPSLGWALVLPLLLVVLQVGGSTGAAHHEFQSTAIFPLDWFGYLLLVIGPLLLTVRERWPVRVLIGVGVVSLVYVLIGYVYGPFIFSIIVAVVHAVKARHRVIAWSTFLGMLAVHFAVLIAHGQAPDSTQLGAITGWVLVVLVSAEVVRGVSERREVRARAREAEEASRITAERLRIARELHDVVAHNISLINVQAGTALHLMDRRPEQTRTALATIKQSSKDTLVELRSILGVLRQADADELDGPEPPAPGLARLDGLVENARRAGLTVDVRSDELGSLPDRVDLAAYRILQEAITNVIRHANAHQIRISLRLRGPDGSDARPDAARDPESGAASGTASGTAAEPERDAEPLVVRDPAPTTEGTDTADSEVLQLRVADDGDGGEAPGGPTGQLGSHSGLVGMRERAEALDGSLFAGPRTGPDGAIVGFEVFARLPLPPRGER